MQDLGSAITVVGSDVPGRNEVLTSEALAFVAELSRLFRDRIEDLLHRRQERQTWFDNGGSPEFLSETRELRKAEWTVASIPDDLQDRRVEITGPVDRKMVINALNSGANVYMADFEDSTSPTWANLVSGQKNLMDAVRGTITHVDSVTGKSYALGRNPAVLFVRPRGIHLIENHLLVDGKPIPGCLFDFGLFFYHNFQALLKQGKRPYFYLPKLEGHLEARLWNDIFVFSERKCGLSNGTIRATMLIETLPAAFEMDEMLYELKDHSVGLNCGRWDYIFSFIKTFRTHGWAVMPDRSVVTMNQPFLRAYADLLVKTCHRRGTFAMGGMAAQIPIKNDEERNRVALEKVRKDKEREVRAGHDGTWVAHPALVAVARDIFDQWMSGPNQIHVKREDAHVTRMDLVVVPQGPRTEAELVHDIDVGLQYIEAWLRGIGCVPLYDLMEDAATAEICRSQVWQWVHHGVSVDDKLLDQPRLARMIDERFQKLCVERSNTSHRFIDARNIFEQLVMAESFEPFLTTVAYERLSSTLESTTHLAA
jgi:malate synthase